MAKIFIGALVYAKRKDVLRVWLEKIHSLSVQDYELHLMDTTAATAPSYAPYSELKRVVDEVFERSLGIKVVIHEYVPRGPHETIVLHIADAREQLRELFLQSGSEYLFFLDDDVLLPQNSLSLLLSHKTPVACGAYLSVITFKDTSLNRDITKLTPVAWIADLNAPGHCKPLLIVDLLALPVPSIPIYCTGFGCALLSREAISRVGILEHAELKSEDAPFFRELYRLGIRAILDPRVKCAHMKYPVGDERNKMLDFANYKVQISKS